MYILTKVPPPSGDIRFWLSCLGPVVVLLPKTFKIICCYFSVSPIYMFAHNNRVSKRYDAIGMSSIGGFILEVTGW